MERSRTHPTSPLCVIAQFGGAESNGFAGGEYSSEAPKFLPAHFRDPGRIPRRESPPIVKFYFIWLSVLTSSLRHRPARSITAATTRLFGGAGFEPAICSSGCPRSMDEHRRAIVVISDTTLVLLCLFNVSPNVARHVKVLPL
jgi:hypothetical protein